MWSQVSTFYLLITDRAAFFRTGTSMYHLANRRVPGTSYLIPQRFIERLFHYKQRFEADKLDSPVRYANLHISRRFGISLAVAWHFPHTTAVRCRVYGKADTIACRLHAAGVNGAQRQGAVDSRGCGKLGREAGVRQAMYFGGR